MKTGVAYLGVRDVDHVKTDMMALVSEGYTHVWHAYSEEDFLFHRDTMVEIINMSADCGLQVYVSPWGMGRVFAGGALSELAARYPQQAQINNLGEKTVASCVNHENFRNYMREWVENVCHTDVDTILWDSPGFYVEGDNEQWCCRCETCEKLFRKRTRHLMPNSLTNSVNAFRTASLLELISEMTGLVHLKGKRNSVCIRPDDERRGICSLESIAELPTVDEIGLKPYWERAQKPSQIAKSYHEASKQLLEVTNRYQKEAQMWIKNYLVAKNNEQSVAEATYAAYNEGIRNMFAWAYKGTKCHGTYRSDDPEKVWNIQTEAFGECREKALMNEMIVTMKALNPE